MSGRRTSAPHESAARSPAAWPGRGRSVVGKRSARWLLSVRWLVGQAIEDQQVLDDRTVADGEALGGQGGTGRGGVRVVKERDPIRVGEGHDVGEAGQAWREAGQVRP